MDTQPNHPVSPERGAVSGHAARTTRPSRIWWLGWTLGVLVAALFVVVHANWSATYLSRVTETRLRNEVLVTPLQRVPAAGAADGQVWIRDALALAEGNETRLRETSIDNAPKGREVHWNSAWAWWLEWLGKRRAARTGEPLTIATETAAGWAHVPVLLTVVALAAAWVGRRQGAWAGFICAVALVGHRGFYEGFLPGYPDHHGLINAALLALILGAAYMGAGWRYAKSGGSSAASVSDSRFDGAFAAGVLPASLKQAKFAAWISGIGGGLALWLSAASACVPIALIGAAGALVALVGGRSLREAGALAEPGVWRLWSRVGAGVSVFCYLFEYAPSHLGLRLEVNSPLYSLAWLGGGELIALVMEWTRNGVRVKKEERTRLVRRALIASPFVLAPLVLILVGGAKWFAPSDPFLARVHTQIDEFKPFWTQIVEKGWAVNRDHLWLHPLIFIGAVVLAWRASKVERVVIFLSAFVALAMTAEGWYQSRWLLTASSAQIVLVLVLWQVLATRKTRGVGVLVVSAVAVSGLFYTTSPWMFLRERAVVAAKRDVQMPEVMQLLYRDIAQQLTTSIAANIGQKDAGAGERANVKPSATGASMPDKMVLLASPNASTAIGYYGRFPTVGTLYWENSEGLRAAAEILCAPDAGTAEKLVRARGVTHIAMISEYSFLEEYFFALYPGRPLAEARNTFGGKLLYDREIPVWLRPINYSVPTQFSRFNFQVDLYAVDFDQPAAAAFYRVGLYQRAHGNLVAAEASFNAAQKADSPLPQAWLREGELRVVRGDFAGAVPCFVEGIGRSPEEKRLNLYQLAVRLLVQQNAVEEAIKLCRAGIAGGNREASIPLARVLATTKRDELRNGVEALRLAREAVRTMPAEYGSYTALAAALAEAGDFAGANGALLQAREWAGASDPKNADAEINALEAEALVYRSGRPWRE